jgi:predicted transcriptional regulator of viral defense system
MMSDIEKTAIDCIDRPDLSGGVGQAATILKAASWRCNWHKTIDYLERIGSKPLIQRYGWLADHVGAEIPAEARARLLRLVRKSRRTFFGSAKPRADAIGYNKIWRVAVNVSEAELHGSAEPTPPARTIERDS